MKSETTILVVDDDPIIIETLNSILEDTYEVLFALNGEDALESVRRGKPDLVLLDIMMPGMNGYEVCNAIKNYGPSANTPIIFISSLEDSADETYGLELGAIDYISKPINPAVVRIRVQNHVELKKSRDLLEKLALTDGLTGLANRRSFDLLLNQEWQRMKRFAGPLSVIMLDIDCFKAFNDTYGHTCGDNCLKKVAQVIGAELKRPHDTSARYGGEEFSCILPGTDHAGAMKIAEAIRKNVIELKIANESSSVSDYVTLSLGVATIDFDSSLQAEWVIEKADKQLYLAKNSGRNYVSGIDLTI
ncbi:MAG: diguanylate cyclase [Alteromonadales bacterium]|nr:diguanylate cyclase [Alteromonadales bacterium]